MGLGIHWGWDFCTTGHLLRTAQAEALDNSEQGLSLLW